MNYGVRPDDRPLEDLLQSSIILLDKPKGPTSHEVVAWAKRILGAEKAGHSGTLDPNVTGVLPTAPENGTRILKNLLDIGKEYVCLMRMHDSVDFAKVSEVLDIFVGDIYQRPPVKSAVKRRVRKRTIYEIEVLDHRDQYVLFRVSCEAGTYIRKLVYDIGVVLGCGANMAELRRTRVGPFLEKDTTTLQSLSDAFYEWKHNNDGTSLRSMLIPLEYAVAHLPRIWVRDSSVDAICHGADIAIPGTVRFDSSIAPGKKVAILSLKDELVAVGVAQLGVSAVKSKSKGIIAKSIRVIMEPGTYPRQWKGVKQYSDRKN